MLDHIVKNGETVHDILNMYHLELEELVNTNLHITDFNNLVSGMKIKIPLLTNEVEQILENTESFVQRYYPHINDVLELRREESTKIVEEKTETVEEKVKEELPPKEEIKEPKPFEEKSQRRAYPGIIPPTYKGTFKKI